MIEALSGIFLALALGSESSDEDPALESIDPSSLKELKFMAMIGELNGTYRAQFKHSAWSADPSTWDHYNNDLALAALYCAWRYRGNQIFVATTSREYSRSVYVTINDHEVLVSARDVIGDNGDLRDTIGEELQRGEELAKIGQKFEDECFDYVVDRIQDWLYGQDLMDQDYDWVWGNEFDKFNIENMSFERLLDIIDQVEARLIERVEKTWTEMKAEIKRTEDFFVDHLDPDAEI